MKAFVLACSLMLASGVLLAQSVFPVRDEGEARDRSYHVVHYRIEVSFDEAKKMVMGNVTITLVPFLPHLSTVDLDAEELNIQKVTVAGSAGTGRPLRYDVGPTTLSVHLDKPYSFRDTVRLTVEYNATPKKGIYFIQPDSGYPGKPWQIWTQGEDMDNHFWFPCYDFPNDKATSEVIATVRSSYTVLSNGKLLGVKEDKAKGTKTFHWSESKPHSSYLIMLAAGDYAVVKDHAGSLPVEYYVYHKDSADAWACLHQTPDMINFFDEKIGFPYAWEKYAQVQIADFMYGGMENTSATTMADQALVYEARQRVDGIPTDLIAHELAHQWWGDVLTCKDWRHIWLNESFASYFDPLYTEYSKGRDEFDLAMYHSQMAGIQVDTTQGRKPIVSVGSYTTNVYPRGAEVLHMLRFVLGDTLFWRAIHHYITKYQFTPVETNDLKLAVEEATGQNLYWFFDEWVYKAGHPIFDVSYRWSDSARAIFLSVKQTQQRDSLTGVFRTPVDVEITTGKGATTHRVNIMNADTTFVLPAAEKPLLVIFDKGNWLLKEVKFNKSPEELEYQAQHGTNPIERIRALQAVAAMKESEQHVPVFAAVSRNDSFWGVRHEAVVLLNRIKATEDAVKDEIKKALVAAAADSKSSIRAAAVEGLESFHSADVASTLRTSLHDSSYSVVENALRSLTRVDSVHAEAVLDSFLTAPSYLDRVSNMAMAMIARVDSPRGIALALEKAAYGQPISTRRTALGILSRYGKKRPEVISLVARMVDDKNRNIRFNAIGVLGSIGDTSVIPSLEKIASDKEDMAAGAARASIERIRKREGDTKE